MSLPSKYFRREGSPSHEEVVTAIRDMEDRLNESESGTSPRCSIIELDKRLSTTNSRIDDLDRSFDEFEKEVNELKVAMEAVRNGLAKL